MTDLGRVSEETKGIYQRVTEPQGPALEFPL